MPTATRQKAGQREADPAGVGTTTPAPAGADTVALEASAASAPLAVPTTDRNCNRWTLVPGAATTAMTLLPEPAGPAVGPSGLPLRIL